MEAAAAQHDSFCTQGATPPALHDLDAFHPVVAEEEAEPEEPGAEEPTVELGKLKLNKRQGTARLPITISHPGSLALRGKGVKGVKRAFAKPGAKTLRIAPKGAKKRALKRRGSVKVTITITYSPDEGEAVELTKKVKLVRRR